MNVELPPIHPTVRRIIAGFPVLFSSSVFHSTGVNETTPYLLDLLVIASCSQASLSGDPDRLY